MADSPAQSGPLLPSDIYGLKETFVILATEFLIHGLYTALVIFALYSLCTQKVPLAARTVLISITIFTFLCESSNVFLDLAFDLVELPELGADPASNIPTILTNIEIGSAALSRINYLLGDAVVIWRAWAIWPHSLTVHILLGVCLAGTVVSTFVDYAYTVRLFLGKSQFDPGAGAGALILTLPLLATNIIATSLIGYKAWVYRTRIKESLNVEKTRRTKVETVLLLLTESGIIYCILWLLVGLFAIVIKNPQSLGYLVPNAITPQLTAIYPIIVILLVALEKTKLEQTMTNSPAFSQSIHFASSPRHAISTAPVEEDEDGVERPYVDDTGAKSGDDRNISSIHFA
ncbi:hypothetical protein C8J56DRAFT_977658 [Mycena floridula]|nr:hypothetical protein C8J56DRAFT_977658 [Mycena floridula]